MASSKQPDTGKRDVGESQSIKGVRGGHRGRAIEERHRQRLDALASEHDIPGRLQMTKWDLIDAIRRRGLT